MSRAARLALVCLMLITLSACAVREKRAAGAWQAERLAWFRVHPTWSVSGRIGLSDGERGGSLRMRWRAGSNRQIVDLSAGVGAKRWQLVIHDQGARLTGSDIGVLEGPNPDRLVEQAVGWPIPVRWMSDWLRGLPAPAAAEVDYAPDGTIAKLAWDGWLLEYQRWQALKSAGPLLPIRIEARRGTHTVRAALGGWRFDDTTPGED